VNEEPTAEQVAEVLDELAVELKRQQRERMLFDLMLECHGAGLDPLAVLTDELRALGYTVTPPR
jgi:hypothetical protein